MKNDYLCTLLITLPFHRKMTNLSILAATEPPSDLAGSDLEVQNASQASATCAHGGPACIPGLHSHQEGDALGGNIAGRMTRVGAGGLQRLQPWAEKAHVEGTEATGWQLGIRTFQTWVQVLSHFQAVTLFSYLQNVYKNNSCFLSLMSGANEQEKCFLRSYKNICCFVGGIIHTCNTALSIGYCTVFKYKSTGIFLGAKYCYFYNSKIIEFNYYDL